MNKLLKHRSRVAQLLQADKHDYWGHWIDLGLMVLIFLNVLAVIFESVSTLEARYRLFFLSFEIFSVVIFTTVRGPEVSSRMRAQRWCFALSICSPTP